LARIDLSGGNTGIGQSGAYGLRLAKSAFIEIPLRGTVAKAEPKRVAHPWSLGVAQYEDASRFGQFAERQRCRDTATCLGCQQNKKREHEQKAKSGFHGQSTLRECQGVVQRHISVFG
jgi:hypothetical protein